MACLWPALARAESNFMTPSEWIYASDQVMGGVSEGQARFEDGALRLSGRVSTANNGGFIQARRPTSVPADAKGLTISVRGDGQRYFIHVRTRGTRLPWQYYQAGFDTSEAWQDIQIPWTAFKPSGGFLRKTPKPENITSVGLVAYGRDHEALVWLRGIEPY